jgi:hypothetical protein
MTTPWEEMRRHGLIQIVKLPGLCDDRAMPSLLLFVHFLDLLLSLHFLSTRYEVRGAVHTPRHHGRVVRDCLVLPHILLMNEVIGGGDGVVSVRFDALDCILIIKVVLILHHFEDLFIVGHLFLPRVEAEDALFLHYFEPRVRSDVIDRVASVRVCVKNFTKKVRTLRTNKFRDLIVCTEDLFV